MAKDHLFGKGKSGNPSGRPKGSKNKKNEMWDDLGEYIVNEGAQRYMKILMKKDDFEFAKRFEYILEYFKPKQSRAEIDAKVSVHPTGFDINIINGKTDKD